MESGINERMLYIVNNIYIYNRGGFGVLWFVTEPREKGEFKICIKNNEM
jgi:hypothetical protein